MIYLGYCVEKRPTVFPEAVAWVLKFMSQGVINIEIHRFKNNTEFCIREPRDDEEGVMYIGMGHSLSWAFENGNRCGFFIHHYSSVDGSDCGGYCDLSDEDWKILNEDPLTIVPSVDCSYCDSHGSIIVGYWHDDRSKKEIKLWDKRRRLVSSTT